MTPHFFYLFALSALSVALGIQLILLPWLVIDELSLSSVWVGWIQAAVLIPNLLLLLLGGLSADRDGVRYLWLVLLVNGLLHGMLAYIIHSHWLSIVLLLGYAGALGITNAFVQPWREYLLHQVNHHSESHSDDGLPSLVAKSSLCVYIGQAAGVFLSSTMDIIGSEQLLLIQLCLVGLSIFGFYRVQHLLSSLAVNKIDNNTGGKNALSHRSQPIIELLKTSWEEMWCLPALRSLLCIVAFNGFFHIGVFIVALPLIVQQVYGQSVIYFSGLQLVFLLGTIVTTLAVIFKKGLDSPGRRVIFGLLYGGVILLSISAKPTIVGLFVLLFFWGVVVGVSATMGRTILQSMAPDHCRGYMISLYQLCLFGFAPLGALFAGYAVQWWGVMDLLKVSGIASLLMFAALMGVRALWDVETTSVNKP
ncbi:MFS transporter [Eionea flava]